MWKFLAPAMASVLLIVALSVTATQALEAQTKLMNGVVNGAMKNALFMADVRSELRGDARELYRILAARAGGDLTTGSADSAVKVSARLKTLQDRVKAAAEAATGTDKTSLDAMATEIGSQRDAIDFVSSMLEIDLNAAISFLGPYGESERKTDAIVQEAINRTDAQASGLAARSVAEAHSQVLLVVILSSLAALTAGGFGLVMGRSTAGSITRIAQATQSLAEGDMTVSPQILNRRDELGKVVDALSVFKSMTEQSRILRTAQDVSDREKLERVAAMEQLIDAFNTDFAHLINGVEKASGNLDASATLLCSTATENTSHVNSAVQSMFNVQESMSTVAAASEELGATIAEVDRQASMSANVALEASDRAQMTQTAMSQLSEAVGRITNIVDLISTIAGQTNLLALNATIEAARAGNAGKGFAVVAHEVKSLAAATSLATIEIRSRLAEVQAAAQSTTSEIITISNVITQMRAISGNTSDSVRQQVLATREITQSMGMALQGAGDATTTMGALDQVAKLSGEVSTNVTTASLSLSRQADQLKVVVETFLRRTAAL